MAEAGPGKVRMWNDFLGPEIPVLNALAYGADGGGTASYLGDYAIRGDLADTDSGAVALAIVNGAVRLTGTNEDNKGCAATTDLVFSPALQGPLVIEARVQMQVLTARETFIGFCGVLADDIVAPVTNSSGEVHSLTAATLCGFVTDSDLTAGTTWHACYNGGTTTGETDSTVTTTGIVAVAAEWDVLRIEIDKNGTARYWINGNLKATVAGAVATTTLHAAIVGVWGTTTTIQDIDVDYMLVTANRDWTR
jgi:hypothetical protein